MAKETVIHLIRHGITQNPNHQIKGRLKGFPLRVDGMLEVKKLANYLSKNNISKIYHSPMDRAIQTAEILQKCFGDIPMKQCQYLNEWDIKPWEGKTVDELKDTEEWKMHEESIMEMDKLKKFGETPSKVISRMKRRINMLLTSDAGKEVVVVSHGDPIKLIRCDLEQKDINKCFKNVKCQQPSITTLVFSGKKLKQVKYKSFIKDSKEIEKYA